MKRGRHKPRIALGAGVVALILTVTATPALAGEIRGVYWSDDGVVLAQGSNANVVGFWQNLLCSNISAMTVDGVFGTITKGRTQSFQTDVAHVTADGIVGSNTWLNTEFATDAVYGYRLQSHTLYYWSYYGGNGSWNASLYMQPNNPYWGDLWWFENLLSANWYDTSTTTNSISSLYCS